MTTRPDDDDDISALLVAKSDQINAADLPRGVSIVARIVSTQVSAGAEQKMTVRLERLDGLPVKLFRPCLGMQRLMAEAWGTKRSAYVDRVLRLETDPDVTYGKEKTGGVRITGMSDVPASFVYTLKTGRTATRPHRVEKLTPNAHQRQPATPLATTLADPLAGFRAHLARLTLNPDDVIAWLASLGTAAAELTPDDRKAWIADLTDPNGEARTDYAAWLAARATEGGAS